MKANPDNSILRSIRAAFADTGWSINRLAKESAVTYASVHGLINGDRDVASSVVARVCEAMGLELRRVRKSKGKR